MDLIPMRQTKQLLILILICCLAGILFFAHHHHLICIHFPRRYKNVSRSLEAAESKTVQLHFFNRNNWHTESVPLIWSSSNTHNIQLLIARLLTHLEEEQILTKQVTINAVLLSENMQHAYISFDRNPFDKQQSIFAKWTLLQSILKTIHQNDCGVHSVTFLVRHEPLRDPHISCSAAWPVEIVYESRSLVNNYSQNSVTNKKNKPFVIVINCNNRDTGRTLVDNYERTLMHQYAQHLKQELEHNALITVIVPRWHNTTDETLAHAQMANRIQADLYVSLHCFHESSASPSLFIYQFSSGKDFVTKTPELWFCPYEQAYLISQQKSTEYSSIIYHACTTMIGRTCTIAQPHRIPFSPLLGITIPALAIECGLRKDDDLTLFIQPIVAGILKIIQAQ